MNDGSAFPLTTAESPPVGPFPAEIIRIRLQSVGPQWEQRRTFDCGVVDASTLQEVGEDEGSLVVS